MKRALFLIGFVGVLLLRELPQSVYAASAFSENKRVVVSTIPASPTLISAASNYQKTILINSSTSYWCLFGDQRTVFSTSTASGTARLTNATFSPDGVKEPYQGAIWGVCENVLAIIECIRIK